MIGRVDLAANRKSGIHRASVKIGLLEEIVRETYLRDQMVEEHFKQYSDSYNGTISEQELFEALTSLGIQVSDSEIEKLIDDFKGRTTELTPEIIDISIEDSKVKPVEELQKQVLDILHTFLKSNPHIRINEIY